MLHRMAAYCSTAERCRQDVQKKTKEAGLSADAAERIISRLQKERFIDEARFAGSFVNDKLRFNKWGRIKIAYELGKRDIPPDVKQKALDGIAETEYQSVLVSLLKEKKKTIKARDERELFYKLMRFASGRGFESEDIFSCLRNILNTHEYPGDFE